MIARPFALAGFSFVFALLALNLVQGSTAVVLPAAAACLLLCLLIRKLPGRRVYAVSMLCVLAACACFHGWESFVYKPALSLCGENVNIHATVVSNISQSSAGYYSCTLKTDGGLKLRFASSDKPLFEAYDTVDFSGMVYEIGGECDDVRTYYKAKSIFLGCSTKNEISVTRRSENSLGFFALSAQSHIVSTLMRLLPGENGAVAAAMVTGDKTGVSSKTRSGFAACGLSHTLAVSGLHMSAVVLAAYELLRKL